MDPGLKGTHSTLGPTILISPKATRPTGNMQGRTAVPLHGRKARPAQSVLRPMTTHSTPSTAWSSNAIPVIGRKTSLSSKHPWFARQQGREKLLACMLTSPPEGPRMSSVPPSGGHPSTHPAVISMAARGRLILRWLTILWRTVHHGPPSLAFRQAFLSEAKSRKELAHSGFGEKGIQRPAVAISVLTKESPLTHVETRQVRNVFPQIRQELTSIPWIS